MTDDYQVLGTASIEAFEKWLAEKDPDLRASYWPGHKVFFVGRVNEKINEQKSFRIGDTLIWDGNEVIVRAPGAKQEDG